MKLNSKLSFDFLQKDVIDRGICGRCGGCVSFCTANRIGALEAGEDGLPRYKNREECLECGLCYLICPQTADLNEDMKEHFNWKAPIGQVADAFSMRAADTQIWDVATDGGVVTALLIDMLQNDVIDGAVVSRREGIFNRQSVVATTPEELIEAAGSSFSEAPHLEEVGAGYTTCVPLAKTIQDYAGKPLKRLAVVGTPCQINAVRKMQVLNILPADIIEFTIGLFCMQCFTVDRLIDTHFIEKHQIDLSHVKKINVKEDFFLHMENGETIHIPLEDVESIAREACLACKNFANDFADISVGGLGSPEGYTTVLVRSTAGKRMMANALYNRAVEYLPGDDSKKFNAEPEQLVSLIQTFTEKKIHRAEKHLKF